MLKISTFLALLTAFSVQHAENMQIEETNVFFESLEKGYWVSDENIISGNSTLFKRFCDMNGMKFERFKEIIADPYLIEDSYVIRDLYRKDPLSVRDYTQEERDAIFVYLNGYESLLMQYAQDMKKDIEKQECDNENFEHFKSALIGLLGGVMSGSWQGALFMAMCHEVITYMVEHGTDLPFLERYKEQADWQYVFYKRIEKAQVAQLLNLRRS